MTEHFLNGAQVGAAFEQMRRERVAEEMRVDPRRVETGPLGQPAQDEKGARARQRAAARVEEELAAVAPVEVRPSARQVAAKRGRGRAPDRHDALLPALAGDADEPAVEVDAAAFEADGLGDP